jgi:hypothetical protein
VTEDVYARQLGLGLWPFFGANCASRFVCSTCSGVLCSPIISRRDVAAPAHASGRSNFRNLQDNSNFNHCAISSNNEIGRMLSNMNVPLFNELDIGKALGERLPR